jgi:hypothetical protein
MRVLRGNPQQVAALNGYHNNNSTLLFFPDYAGNMTTSVNVVDNPDFQAIRNDLLQLEEIDYVEFPIQEDI